MTLPRNIREQMRRAFQQRAGEAFDAMFDEDQQEQLITLTQREDRILEKGAELQAWLMEQHLSTDPLGEPAAAEAIRCPKCRRLGVREPNETEPVPRSVTTRAGEQQFQRGRYRCPSCRTVFFPLGR